MERILGISFETFNTSACLLEGGRVVAACAEERFSRKKLTREFPRRAVRYCLKTAGCRLSDIDHIVVGWNPVAHMNRFAKPFAARSRWPGEQLALVPSHFFAMQEESRVTEVWQELKTPDRSMKIVYLEHHKAHAGNFFLSPYEEAAILTCDGRGETETMTLSVGRGNSIRELGRQTLPHSLGMLYGSLTRFLGFEADRDEWKVMALAGFWPRSRENPMLPKLRRLVRLLPDGRFSLDMNYFRCFMGGGAATYTDELVADLGPPRKPGDSILEFHHQIAHALQLVTEEVVAHVLRDLYGRTRLEALVVSGGVFLNTVLNGRIEEMTPFKKVFISSCPDDLGISLGAAVYLHNQVLGRIVRPVLPHCFLGPESGDEHVRGVLDGYKLPYRRVDDVESYTAQKLAEGKIVGWIQGRMEFSQRALGNRSILADPRRADMKDRINRAVKHREEFRPFALSVLKESAEEYLDLRGVPEIPFMERVCTVREEKRRSIPSVVHVDGSARVQTVARVANPKFYNLIEEFRRLTGIPLLLNTSFNTGGEPMVCWPVDAVRTFYSCGLDALVLGNCVLEK